MPTDDDAAVRPEASMLGAATGAGVLIAVALPLFAHAVLWSVLDPGAASWPTLVTMAAVGVCVPVPLAVGIALWRQADARATALLVAVPQAVLFVPLFLIGVWSRT